MSRRRRVVAALCAVTAAVVMWSGLAAQTSVTLPPTTNPSSAQPGIQLVTVTGSNFPTGTILPANVTVSVAPVTAGAGPSGSSVASAIQLITGSTRRITFQVPAAVVVGTPTAYRVTVAGATSTGVKFASGNSAALTVNPPASLVSVVPGSGLPSQKLSVTLTATFTNFVQGPTQADFGPGISVGGAAEGGFGPVTVTSATTATAQIAINAAASAGPRSVSVKTGVQQATRAAGFAVASPNQAPSASAGGPYSARVGDPITFNASASTDPDGDPLTYAWTFGDGGTGSGVSPAHTYTTANTFTATVTVSDGRGGTHSASAQVTVRANQIPSASAGGPYSATVNQPLTFSAAGSSDPDGDALTYTWTFGDGSTGTGVSPTHTYTTANTFTATVTVSDGRGGIQSASAQVTIQPANQVPSASAGGPYSVRVNDSLTFSAAGSSDPDGDALTYTWTFGDGATGTGVSPTHIYTTVNTFTATVTVSDGRGGTHSASAQVTVRANQVPSASAGGPYSATLNQPLTFSAAGSTDADSDPLTYSWTFGDGGTGTGVSPTHSYTSTGTFTATVTVSDDHGGSQSANAQVTISLTGPPVLSLLITQPVAGQTLPASPITVRGTVSDPLARVVVQNVIASVTGTLFEARNITLTEGINQVEVRAVTIGGAQAAATLPLTLDSVPPALTVFSPPDRSIFTTTSTTVSATVSDATALTCSINGSPVTIQSGLISSTATLASGANQVSVSCQDAAGHASNRALTLFLDAAPLVISAVEPADNAIGVSPTASIRTQFSEPVDPTTVTAATAFVRAGNAILPANVSVSPDGLMATIVPIVPLPHGTEIVVTVTSGVRDASGNPMAVPFNSEFVTDGTAAPPGVVVGEVYDDGRSLPLEGARVEALDRVSRQVLAMTETDGRGKYFLNPGQSNFVLRISMPGFTSVERAAVDSRGSYAEAMDARLTAKGASQTIQALLGGEVRTPGGDAVVIPPGAFTANTAVTLTPISGQGPIGVFPPGWTPLSIVDFDAPQGAPLSTTFRLVDHTGMAGGRTATLAHYDTVSASWLALAQVLVPTGMSLEFSESLEPGQFALLVPDEGEGAPGATLRGQPLPASAAGTIPVDAQATGEVSPPVGRVDDPTPAAANIDITSPTPLRSGTVLRGDFMEVILLRSGGQVSPLDTSQDFVSYRALEDASGRTLVAEFPIAPSQVFNPADVTDGSITVRLSRGLTTARSVIGANGGGVSSADGSRVLAPSGAFSGDVPVDLRRLDAATFPLATAPNLTFVGGLELNLSGVMAAVPLTLSLSGSGSNVPTGSTVVVAELRNVKGVERLVIVALGQINGSDLTSVPRIGGIETVGVRQSGRYGFYRFDGALSAVNGTARDAAGRRDGHITELASLPFVSVTNNAGTFVLVSQPGSFNLVATAAANGDQARVNGTTGTPLAEIVIGATPPRVEEIKVRLAQLEGDFAGPVTLLGKPAPVVDDDSSGDSFGNGNGQIEAGERIQLTLFVRNDGTIPVQGGFFVLDVRGPPEAIQVQPANIPLAFLPPDEPLAVGPFVFTVPAGTNPSALRYRLAYANNGGLANVVPFVLPPGVEHPNVPSTSEITIRFSEAIVESSLNGSVTLSRENGASVIPEEVALLVASDNRSLIMRPFKPLASDTVYRITLTSQVADVDGRSLANAPYVERLRTEDRTPPPLVPAGQIEASVPDGDGFITIRGSQGSVNPDDIVIGLNATTGFSALAAVNSDGSFTVRIRADATDEVSVLIRDRNDNTTTIAAGILIRRDPDDSTRILGAVVGRNGGTVSAEEGIRLIVPAGSVQRGTELWATRLTTPSQLPSDLQANAALVAAFNAGFTVVDRVRITSNVTRFAGPIKLSVPVPEGAAAGDQFVVWRTRSVTFGGPLADIDRLTGIPLAENPIVTADRLEIVESATVKSEGGLLVLSTDSPPFPGITEPGDFTIGRVNGSLTYLAGEVRRDSVTGPVVPGVVVRSLPGALVTSPFAAVTDDEGKFLVANGALTGPFEVGAVVTSRLDAVDHQLNRVIRRDVRGTVGLPAPPETVVAHLGEPFVLPSKLPPEITDDLGDLEPPTVELVIEGPAFSDGFSAVGSPLRVTVNAADNDQVVFVALELDQGAGFSPVSLSSERTFNVTPSTTGLLVFRGQALDGSGKRTVEDAWVRILSAGDGGGLCDLDDPNCVQPLPSSSPPRPRFFRGAFDGAIEVQFWTPLDRTTVNDQTVRLLNSMGDLVPHTLRFARNDSRIILLPEPYLRLGAAYSVALVDGITSSKGVRFSPTIHTFDIGPPELIAVIGKSAGEIPPRDDVLAINGETVEDIDTLGDKLVVVSHPRGVAVGDRGHLHAFQLQFDADGKFAKIDTLTSAPVPVLGRPLSLATAGGRAYVGNRFLGAIATKAPFFSPVVVGAEPLVFPETMLGCALEVFTAVCFGFSQLWENFPQPASNLEVFDLGDARNPIRLGGSPINSGHQLCRPGLIQVPGIRVCDVWDPNTWPNRVEVSPQGIGLHNFLNNIEFFSPEPTPLSRGIVGQIKRYGEVTPRGPDGRLGTDDDLDNEFLDAAFFDRFAVTLVRDGLRVMSTSPLVSPENSTERGFESLPGTHGGRLGGVGRFQWGGTDGVANTSDLAFVTTTDNTLRIFNVTNPGPPVLMGVLANTFGNMSFDPCRGIAFVHGRLGEFHVIDFNNPLRPVELNELLTVQTALGPVLLGRNVSFNGNANRDGIVYLVNDDGVAAIHLKLASDLRFPKRNACARLRIHKDAPQRSVNPGDGIEFRISLGNDGPATAHNVQLRDEVPIIDGVTWSVDNPTECKISDENVLECAFNDLVAGATKQVSLTSSGITKEKCGQSVDNFATASATNSDDVISFPVSVEVSCPRLELDKYAERPIVTAGEEIAFVITLTIDGQTAAHDVEILDLLPTNAGLNWSIDNVPGCGINTGILTCSFNRLLRGSRRQVRVRSSTTQDTCGTVSNWVSASAANAPTVNVGPVDVRVLCPVGGGGGGNPGLLVAVTAGTPDNITRSVNSYRINRATGTVTSTGPPEEGGAPSSQASVAISPNGNFAYVVGRNAGAQVWAYTIDANLGSLTPVAGSPYATPFTTVAVTVAGSGRFVYVAGGGNQVAAYEINANGGLLQIAGSPFTLGVNVTALVSDPDGQYLYSAGTSTGAFAIDAVTGALNAVSGSPFAPVVPGAIGLAIDPQRRFLYVAGSGIGAYAIDSVGALTPVLGSPFGQRSGCCTAVTVDGTGQFVYASANPAIPGAAATLYGFAMDGVTGALTDIASLPFAMPPGSFDTRGVAAPEGVGNHVYAVDAATGLAAYGVSSLTGALTLRGATGPGAWAGIDVATLPAPTATLVSLQIVPSDYTISSSDLGLPLQFTAVGIYSDASSRFLTESVAWSSSNPLVAVISNQVGGKGLVSTAGYGQTTISANIGGMSGTATLTVNPAGLGSLTTPRMMAKAAGLTTKAVAGGKTEKAPHNSQVSASLAAPRSVGSQRGVFFPGAMAMTATSRQTSFLSRLSKPRAPLGNIHFQFGDMDSAINELSLDASSPSLTRNGSRSPNSQVDENTHKTGRSYKVAPGFLVGTATSRANCRASSKRKAEYPLQDDADELTYRLVRRRTMASMEA